MSTQDHCISIIVDDRERRAGVVHFLNEMSGVSTSITRLPVGDYVVDDRLIFERKILRDFASSLIDGRLFRQMIRLSGSKYKGVLLIEGTGKDLVDSGVRREALQGALITISLILGIPVLRSQNPPESARLMLYVARQVNFYAGGGIPSRAGLNEPHPDRIVLTRRRNQAPIRTEGGRFDISRVSFQGE